MMEPLRTYESWGWQYVVFSNQIFPPFLVLRLGREIIKEFLFFVINGTHPPTARTGVSAHDIAQFLLPDTISRRMLEAWMATAQRRHLQPEAGEMRWSPTHPIREIREV